MDPFKGTLNPKNPATGTAKELRLAASGCRSHAQRCNCRRLGFFEVLGFFELLALGLWGFVFGALALGLWLWGLGLQGVLASVFSASGLREVWASGFWV